MAAGVLGVLGWLAGQGRHQIGGRARRQAHHGQHPIAEIFRHPPGHRPARRMREDNGRPRFLQQRRECAAHIGRRQLRELRRSGRAAMSGPVHHIHIVAAPRKERRPAFAPVGRGQIGRAIVEAAMQHHDGWLFPIGLRWQQIGIHRVLGRAAVEVVPCHRRLLPVSLNAGQYRSM
ncbi:hypothetical protein D3C71_1494670 [compost metagenome]